MDEVNRFTELERSLDVDPVAAVEAARAWLRERPDPDWRVRLAGILVDGGSITHDPKAVATGEAIYRRTHKRFPDRADIMYNLANALVVLTDLDPRDGSWRARTAKRRREARALYSRAGKAGISNRPIATQALTNLGNALDHQGRWVEAYDAYIAALRVDPRNGVASGCVAELLGNGGARWLAHAESLDALQAQYARHSQDNAETVLRYAGAAAVQTFGALPLGDPAGARGLPTPPQFDDEYRIWVLQNRLALTPFIESIDPKGRLDSLILHSIRTGVDAVEPPPIFAMFNSLKEDFAFTRQIAFDALHRTFDETADYTDTLDYAKYGIASAALRTAQRCAIDLLDRIAVATADYLQANQDPAQVYFNELFQYERPGSPSIVAAEIRDQNHAVVALVEVAFDLEQSGFLNSKRQLRNQSTHRFVVMHDLMNPDRLTTPAVLHLDEAVLGDELLETLHLARAAIVYFCEMVYRHEHSRPDEGFVPPLFLPSHREVRGF